MEDDMTPINRLIPQTSGSQAPHRSETESMREHLGGPGMTPPIRPQASGDSQGDDIVSEILRDTQEREPTPSRPMQMPQDSPQRRQVHPSEFQDPEYPEKSVHFEDEMPPPRPPTPTPSPSFRKDENDTDYIGMILDEMKLPLIVTVLILGASSTGLDSTIAKFLPSFLNVGGSGGMGYGGMILKSVIGGLLFYVLHRIFL
jgi:hypothetical protein